MLLGVILASTLAGCDGLFAEPDLRPRDVSSKQAQQALTSSQIQLPKSYEFVAGRVTSVAFVGTPDYDLRYDAPAAVFDDPKQLEDAYTGTTYGYSFPPFRPIDCSAELFSVARQQNWITCTPQTRAKFSTSGNDPDDTSHPMYRNSIAVVAGEEKTLVLVVVGGL